MQRTINIFIPYLIWNQTKCIVAQHKLKKNWKKILQYSIEVIFYQTIILLWVNSHLQPSKDIDYNLSFLTPSNHNPKSLKTNNSIVPNNLSGIILIVPPIAFINTTTPIINTTRKPKLPLSNNLNKKIENKQNRKEYQDWPTLGIELGSSFIKLKAKELIFKIEPGRNLLPLSLLLVLSLGLTGETKVR